MSKKVILISGKARSGKDTLAKVLGDYLKEQGKDVLITHYADSLKYICETVFKWDGKKDEKGILFYSVERVCHFMHPKQKLRQSNER